MEKSQRSIKITLFFPLFPSLPEANACHNGMESSLLGHSWLSWVTYGFPKCNVKQKSREMHACRYLNNLFQIFFSFHCGMLRQNTTFWPGTPRPKANLLLCNKVRAFWKKETEILIYLFLNFPPSNIEYWLRAFHEFFQ